MHALTHSFAKTPHSPTPLLTTHHGTVNKRQSLRSPSVSAWFLSACLPVLSAVHVHTLIIIFALSPHAIGKMQRRQEFRQRGREEVRQLGYNTHHIRTHRRGRRPSSRTASSLLLSNVSCDKGISIGEVSLPLSSAAAALSVVAGPDEVQLLKGVLVLGVGSHDRRKVVYQRRELCLA